MPTGGWLRAIRQALGMSSSQMAQRLGQTRQRVLFLEKGEVDGKITLNTLRNAADALGCELVYCLVPRTDLEIMVSTRAREIASAEASRIEKTMALENQSVGESSRERLVQTLLERMSEKRLWLGNGRSL